jgi:hypothetical protein
MAAASADHQAAHHHPQDIFWKCSRMLTAAPVVAMVAVQCLEEDQGDNIAKLFSTWCLYLIYVLNTQQKKASGIYYERVVASSLRSWKTELASVTCINQS